MIEVEVSVTISDPTSGEALGAMTIGVDLDRALAVSPVQTLGAVLAAANAG